MFNVNEIRPSNIDSILGSVTGSSSDKIYKFLFVEEGLMNGEVVEVYYAKESAVEEWASKNLGEYEQIELFGALDGSGEYDNETVIDPFLEAVEDGKIKLLQVKKAKVKFNSFGDLVRPRNCVALYPSM